MTDAFASVFGRFVKQSRFGGSRARAVDLRDSYRIDLITELDRLGADDPERETIRKLLDPVQSERTWEKLYEAEQRLAYRRDDNEVKADWARRSVEARNLGVNSVDALQVPFTDAAATEFSRKAIYLRLLDDLHFRYARRRLDRQTRRQTATWLNTIGLIVCISGLVVFLVGWSYQHTLGSYLGQAHLIYAIWCGLLGAYFSSSVSMRTTLATLDYDLLVSGYSKWSIVQRLLIGGIAAFLIYLLIAGGLLAGDLFPSAVYSNDLLNPDASSRILAIPSVDLAKLLVWSVIAGFSERLLPDQLGRLENSIRDGGPERQRPSN
ncbi:hypothetical protein HFO41_33260 [Rhizobium leguminosarum]|uniref:hypothetical protein n=1 Tax=Rhizobium leguminosarum TaxID=384 RepID=UPI001C95D35F|nr:hypothetical protein [Rhizobium leguminosarum]MBY5693628.1 hypothetical protein [Rhizobium leguminosarum]